MVSGSLRSQPNLTDKRKPRGFQKYENHKSSSRPWPSLGLGGRNQINGTEFGLKVPSSRRAGAPKAQFHTSLSRSGPGPASSDGSIPCFLLGQSRQGRQTIARQFIAGVYTPVVPSPVRDDRNKRSGNAAFRRIRKKQECSRSDAATALKGRDMRIERIVVSKDMPIRNRESGTKKHMSRPFRAWRRRMPRTLGLTDPGWYGIAPSARGGLGSKIGHSLATSFPRFAWECISGRFASAFRHALAELRTNPARGIWMKLTLSSRTLW